MVTKFIRNLRIQTHILRTVCVWKYNIHCGCQNMNYALWDADHLLANPITQCEEDSSSTCKRYRKHTWGLIHNMLREERFTLQLCRGKYWHYRDQTKHFLRSNIHNYVNTRLTRLNRNNSEDRFNINAKAFSCQCYCIRKKKTFCIRFPSSLSLNGKR